MKRRSGMKEKNYPPVILTWEDIDILQDIMNEVHYEYNCGISAECFGEEVISRFYDRRK